MLIFENLCHGQPTIRQYFDIDSQRLASTFCQTLAGTLSTVSESSGDEYIQYISSDPGCGYDAIVGKNIQCCEVKSSTILLIENNSPRNDQHC